MAGAPGLVFEIVGRLVTIAVLGFSILRGGANPLLFLWGLWIEEVLSLAGLSVRQAILHQPRLRGVYAVFPAAHLVFVLGYSLAGVTGMFSSASAPLLVAPSTRSVLSLAGVLLVWTAADLVRSLLHRRGSGEHASEEGRVDREVWLALFLPHITIIAGGFCMVMLRLGNWMAWGILAGKILFEALSFAFARGAGRRARADGSHGSPGAQRVPPIDAVRGS